MESGRVKYFGTYEELQHSTEIKHIMKTIADSYMEEEEKQKGELDDSNDDDNSSKKCNLSKEGANITEDENNELSTVSWNVYWNLIFSNKSWIISLFLIPLFVVYALCAVNTSYNYGRWIENAKDSVNFWSYFRLALVSPLGFSTTLFVLVTLVLMSILRKSRITHEEMVIKTINAPINLYFDKTPSGKILNRYSRDLNKVDTQIGR